MDFPHKKHNEETGTDRERASAFYVAITAPRKIIFIFRKFPPIWIRLSSPSEFISHVNGFVGKRGKRMIKTIYI